MKYKYLPNMGLAFNEKGEMKKLEDQSLKGWHFKKFSCFGFLYKLQEGPKSNNIYSIDYNYNPDKEYYSYFAHSGWDHITSYSNAIHVFTAPHGTKPIYSNSNDETIKYQQIYTQTRRGSISTAIAIVIFFLMATMSLIYIKPLFLVFLALTLISIIIFIFNIMPFIAFKGKINK